MMTAAGEEGDPVPIRRLLLPAARVPAEMKRLEQGALVRLSRADFEARVRAAARGRKARPEGPRLVEARYRAALVDESLVGSAEWKVAHDGPGAGLLRLQQPPQAFNLALQQPRFQNRDALVAAFDGRHLALLVDRPGEHAVALEWSARSEARPEGLHFDLKVPPCPVASLELNLPADRVVSLLDGALVSGPHPAETADRRLWKIVCSGRPQVDLLVRRAPGAPGGQPALLLARQKTVQKLSPEGVEATFEFTLESLHQGMRELVLECDPALRPTEVVIADLDTWELRPGAPPKTPALLTVRLREPLQQGTLQIHCIAPLGGSPRGTSGAGGPRPFDWTSPGVRMLGAVPRGETLELILASELRAEDWHPGDFRLVETSASRGPGPRTQSLMLVGGGVMPDRTLAGTPPRRPRARLRARGVEFRAVQKAWWRLGRAGMALTLQVSYEVSQGQLFQLPLLLPVGWEVEQVDLNPSGWLRASGVRRVGGRDLLQVDLRKPLGTGGTGRDEGAARGLALTVRLRPARPEPVTGRELAFPNAESPGARFREGTLAVDFDEQVYEPVVKTAAPRTGASEKGPWGEHVPDYVYRYRGAPVVGTLRLRPRPPRVRAQCNSSVFVAAGRAAVETRLALWAEVGSPESVELRFSASGGGRWEWRAAPGRRGGPAGNRVRRAERLDGPEAAMVDALGALAAANPLRAALRVARPRNERWRLTLERPLSVHEPLVLLATRKLEPRGNRWEVPLPHVVRAGRMEGEVTLHLAGAADRVSDLETAGLREAPGATAWRTFRYGPGPARLTLRGQVLTADRSTEAVAGPACLTTFLGGDGVAEHHFTFRMANWPQWTLPVRLPAGARPVAAQVDGCWLPWLVTPQTEGRETLDLPVPHREGDGGDGRHVFEVIYWGSRSWAEEARAEAPVLPVPPLSLRRRWRAAPGVRPLLDGPELRLPGAEKGLSRSEGRRRPGDLFRLGAGLGPAWPGADRAAEARRLLADASVDLRRGDRPGQTVTLRELVGRVVLEFLRDRHPLVVDTAALRQAGLNGATRLPLRPWREGEATALPWEERGLVALAMGPATLLTTRSQEDLWRPASGGPAALSAPLGQALAEAVSRGRDATGRFRSALDWLRPGAVTNADGEDVVPLLSPGGALAPWEEWAPRAGEGDRAVPLARRSLATAGGLAAMTFLCLMLWWGRRLGTRRRLAFLLLWLAAAGLGVLWLPTVMQDVAWWPLLAGCVLALAWYLLAVLRVAPAPRVRTAAATSVTAGLVLLAVVGRGAPPATPGSATVYLLAGPADKQAVLAPPELLVRLAALAAPPAAPTGTVLVAAEYDGKVAEGAADFGAVFVAHSLTDGPTTLVLPLAGVRLYGDVWLDGARAYPETLPRPRSGYALTVRGRGRHKIELRFRVPVTGSAGDRNIRFTAPRLAQSRLGLWVPPGATALQALVRHGAGRIKAEAGGSRLNVALGAVNVPLHFRWRQESRPPVRTKVQYQEAYLWDLRPEASSLTALLHYRIPHGAVTSLRVGLPKELEVRAAEANRAAPAGPVPPATGVRLRDWRVTGMVANRALELTFPGPVEGEFDVMLQLVPRGPLPATVTLPLPEPQGERLPDGGYLAYQTTGLEAHRGNLLSIRGIPAAKFAPFWPAASRPDPRVLAYAAEIGRDPGHPPMLGLRLHLPAPVVEVTQDVTVRVGPAQADVRATAKLTAPNQDLSLVEWEINSARPLTVASVGGPNVLRWSRQGNRLLVWLRQTSGTTTLELSGWVPLTPGGMNKGPHLDLPALRVVGARSQQTDVRLVAGPGLALVPRTRYNLWPLPDTRLTTSEMDYVTRDWSYGGRWLVRPGAGPTVRVLTFVEMRDRQLTFTATLDYEIPQGELRAVELRLRNWEGKVERLEGRGVVPTRERYRGPSDRSWVVPLQPKAAGRFRLTMRGTMPAEAAAGGVRMPEVTVSGVVRADYQIAVAGNELRTIGATGLARLADSAKTLAAWPDAAEVVRRTRGSAWRVAAPNWELRLVPQGQVAAAPVRVFLMEQTAVVVDGRRWLHEAVCWLRHETHTDLYLSFPKRAEVVAVSVDGREMAPLQPEPSRLWLPLPGRAGVCRVRLRWRYDEGGESLGRPNLERPVLEGAGYGPAVWTVCVPAGWVVGRAPSSGSLGTGATRAAALALYRAEAQLGVSQALAEQGGGTNDGLAAAQQRFYLECRHAGRALAVGGTGVTGPSGQGPGDWLRDLRQRNAALAARHGFEAVRKEAEALAARDAAPPVEAAPADDAAVRFTDLGPGRTGAGAGGPLPEWGLPASWYAAAGGATPQVQLVSEEDGRIRAAVVASGQWLALLAAIWAIALSPYLTSRLRPLWPEGFVLLGTVGWQLAGPTLVVLVLLLAGVCGRLLLLGQWLGRLWPRPAVVGTSHNARP